MKKSLAALGLSLMLLSSAAFAVPSLQQVEQSIAQRDWQRADAQLSQVVDAHPNNAHARYLYAQVLDREGRAADALVQLQRAKTLDPQLPPPPTRRASRKPKRGFAPMRRARPATCRRSRSRVRCNRRSRRRPHRPSSTGRRPRCGSVSACSSR
ncbi:TPR repeat protein [Burkholderia multivorans CGD1]|nr:TPR repeat protein [Burkholderia multivorans CGD1]